MRQARLCFAIAMLLIGVHEMNAQIGVPVSTPPPPPPSMNGTPVGTGGFATYYYMVVANYPMGAVQSGIFALAGANPTLNTTNFNQLGWQLPTASQSASTGALSFDVLRLPSNVFTGSCTCSVATGLTTNTYADKGTSLSSYTITPAAFGANATLYLDNRDYDFPKLRISVGQAVQGALQQDHLAEIPHAAALTTYCSVGDLMVEVAPGGAPGTYQCLTINTWTLIGGGGGGGTVTSVTASCGILATPNPIIAAGTIADNIAIGAHNGSYTLLTADCGKSLTTNTTAAWAVPQAGSTGFTAGWHVLLQNVSASSVLTVTTTTSTFYGNSTSGSSVTIAAGNGVELISDGTNWQVLGYTAPISASGCAASGIAGQVQASNGSGACQQANVGNSQPSGGNTATHNNQLGAGALAANTSGDNNTALGNTALAVNTTGYGNTAIGSATLAHNLTSGNNIAIGTSALTNSLADETDLPGQGNIALGFQSMQTNTTGHDGIGIGYQALISNTVGFHNIGIGTWALQNEAGAANDNIGIGFEAGRNVAGIDNVVVGSAAISLIAGSGTSGQNVAVGAGTGTSMLTGNLNTLIGNGAGGANTGGSNNLYIGASAGLAAPAAESNQLYVDSIAAGQGALLRGDFSARTLKINGQFSTPVNTVTFSATPVFNMNLGDQTITLTGNVTSFTVTNVVAGQKVNIQICQDGTGSRTISGIPGNVKGFFTIGGTLSTCSVQSFESFDGTNLYATSTGVINE